MSLLNDASLVMIPSGYKDGTLYSAKPTNGDGDFTFSRGSNLAATRVNSEGLIEKGRENLFTYSNTFTSWSNIGGTMVGGQSGYDGSSNAYLFTMSTGANICSQTNTQSGIQTLSVYAKGSVNNGLRLYAFGTSNSFAYFDLNIGAVETTNAVVDANIEDKGNGWYRCSMTFNQTNSNIYFYLSNNNNSNAGSGSILIQDAQLESGLVATDVITTTTTTAQAGILEDMPRLDYSGGASCPSLLLEPQRSNVLPHSEYFNSSDWTKLGAGTGDTAIVTTNYDISPEGLQNATRLQCDLNGGGTSSSNQSLIYDVYSGSGSQTLSIYAKSNTGENQTIYLANTQTTGDTITVTPEWQRFTFTHSSSPYVFAIGLRGRTGGAINDTADILIYGAMAESSASYQSSYIPTYGASVTRGKDIVDGAVDANLFNDDEGVLFVEFAALADTRDNEFRFFISDGTNDERVQIGLQTSNTLYCSVIVSSSAVADFTTSLASPSSTHKVAIRYKTNDFAAYVDGVQIGTDTSGVTPSGLDRLDFYRTPNNNNYVEANVKQTIYFNTALSNDELASLTTI